MATNRGVVYIGPGKVEVQGTDYPKFVAPNGKEIDSQSPFSASDPQPSFLRGPHTYPYYCVPGFGATLTSDASIWPTIGTRGDQRNAPFISSFARIAHSSDREKVRVRARVRPCFQPIHFVRRDSVAKRAGSLYSVAQYQRSDVSRFDLFSETGLNSQELWELTKVV